MYPRLAARLPPAIAARLDWGVPEFRESWGGPFNGQEARAELAGQILGAMSVTAIVETGTYRGTTTAFLSRFGVPVYTVEVSQRFYLYARRRFRATSHVHIERLDSRTFLRRLADRADFPKERVFFYLDSHWYADLPLREELRIVSETWRESVVMIDDFRVPEDPGYGFDDYGPGAALALDYIAPELAGFRVFWPAAPSETDTGARRGCVVLASRGPVAARLAALPTLREDGG